jgi:hypothetical protein
MSSVATGGSDSQAVPVNLAPGRVIVRVHGMWLR